MRFITRYDLYNTINQVDVDKLTTDDSVLNYIIKRAVAEVKSYLQHRYDYSQIFIEVLDYAVDTTFAVDDFVFDGTDKYYTCILESAGQPLTNTTYFTEGDTREDSIVDLVCIITSYKLFRKIQPRNIPEWIVTEYDNARNILKEYSRGTRTVILPVQLDEDGEEEGHNIMYGSSDEQKDWRF